MKALYQKYKIYILFGVVAIAVVFAFFFFFDRDQEAPLVSQTSEESDAQSAIGRDLLQQLLELRSLKLNESIFSEPAFRLFQDFGRDIPPQPVGRENPFVPFR